MTYYVAKSTRDDDPGYRYICVSEDMRYSWSSAIANVTPTNLPSNGHYDNVNNIEEWLADLPEYDLEFILSFTELSHPEFFI